MERRTYPNTVDYTSTISSFNKKIIESYPAHWYSEFLIMACRIANGDLRKNISIHDVWSKLGFKAIADNELDNVSSGILNVLTAKLLIIKVNKEEICVTERGIDLSVQLTKEPYTNFGLLAPEEVMERSQVYVYKIYNETDIRKRPIYFSEIEKIFGGITNPPAIEQMLRLYNRHGWIKFDEIKRLVYGTSVGLNYIQLNQ